MIDDRTKHFLRVLAVVIGLSGLILCLAKPNDPPCCPYPSTFLPRKTLPVDRPSYRDVLLEQQRIKYLQRHANSCR